MIDEMELIDLNGQIMARFLNLGEDGILGFPCVPLMHEYIRDVSVREWVFPGQRWTMGGFLGYLSGVASLELHGIERTYELGNRRGRISLTTEMSALDLAYVLGIDVGTVRDMMHNHLTFREARRD